MKKFFLILILTFTVLTNVGVSASTSFNDVKENHWAATYIEKMKDLNIINGYEDDSFKPENNVKTGEFIKMLCMTIWPNYIYESEENMQHWAKPYVFSLDKLILDRKDYGPKRCEKEITRAEAAILLCDFVVLQNAGDEKYGKIENDEKYIKELKDENLITDKDTRIKVDNCIRFGLINGFEDGTFRPNDTLTRAQAAKLIYFARSTYKGEN